MFYRKVATSKKVDAESPFRFRGHWQLGSRHGWLYLVICRFRVCSRAHLSKSGDWHYCEISRGTWNSRGNPRKRDPANSCENPRHVVGLPRFTMRIPHSFCRIPRDPMAYRGFAGQFPRVFPRDSTGVPVVLPTGSHVAPEPVVRRRFPQI